jgi:hypothetical protein
MAYLAPHSYISIQPLQSTLITALYFKNPDLYTIYTRFFQLKKNPTEIAFQKITLLTRDLFILICPYNK